MNPAHKQGELYTKVVFLFGSSTCAVFGFIIAILLVMEPCTAPYLMSMSKACLSGNEVSRDFWMVVILIVEIFLTYFVYQPAAFAFGNVLLGYGISLKKYLLVLQE